MVCPEKSSSAHRWKSGRGDYQEATQQASSAVGRLAVLKRCNPLRKGSKTAVVG